MPISGADRYHHWDTDPEPRFDLDPQSLGVLDAVWARYRDEMATAQAARRDPNNNFRLGRQGMPELSWLKGCGPWQAS
jgi:hypothetical protein